MANLEPVPSNLFIPQRLRLQEGFPGLPRPPRSVARCTVLKAALCTLQACREDGLTNRTHARLRAFESGPPGERTSGEGRSRLELHPVPCWHFALLKR